MTVTDSGFFSRIPGITKFSDVSEQRNFFPAPDDWIIVVADVRRSTHAIAEGRYKDVNMIGGAVICAVQNATGSRYWPFVFGGDGATLLVNPAVLPEVEAALVRTRSLARQEFDLELRVGFVPVSEVREQGANVLVARYEITPGNSFAMFGGGGVELADKLIKADATSAQYSVPEYSLPDLPDLSGLSCRWEPLRSQKGRILCLLIKPQAVDFQRRQTILSGFLEKLCEVTGEELSRASPLTERTISLRWPPKGLLAEARMTRGEKSFARRLMEITLQSLIQWVLDKFDLAAGDYDAKAYREELRKNSDYCKFDDVLRMVLDCSSVQIGKIRSLLDDMHEQGEINFGLFETEQALMTCLLFNLGSSEHLHFIDGDNGGFSAASVELKQQLAFQRGETDPLADGNRSGMSETLGETSDSSL